MGGVCSAARCVIGCENVFSIMASGIEDILRPYTHTGALAACLGIMGRVSSEDMLLYIGCEIVFCIVA